MPLQVGIVGLPNAGKTTLFNALTHAGAEVTAYASVVEKANVGMAVLADDRLTRLAELEALLADVQPESRSSETIGMVRALPMRD